jgi:hypothetical protein
MRIRLIASIAVSCLLHSGANADTNASTVEQKNVTPDANIIVCKAGDPLPGSRLPGPRVCRTQGEWDRMREETQNQLKTLKVPRCGSGSGEGMGGGNRMGTMRGMSCS